MRFTTCIATAFALWAACATASRADTVPAENVLVGDGRVSAFYRYVGTIPVKPGTPLRTEALPKTLGLLGAAKNIRMLYSSTDGLRTSVPVVVSGALFVPAGTPPVGGWPIIAWAHGTVGIADICAPSYAARSYRDITYLQTWLAQGYAVVATDYQGLGTPGPHPYLNTRAAAYSVLDAVRASLAIDPSLANRVVIVGQSQGGGAAFGTAGYAPTYAPDVHVVGTVATGVPYFGPNVPSAGETDPTAVDPGIAYIFYFILGAQPYDASIVSTDMFTPKALPLFEVARSSCIYALEDDVKLARLTDAESLLPGLGAVFAKHGAELAYATLAIASPVFIGTGLNDHDVRPIVQEQLVKDACAAGTVVEAHTYTGLTHDETVNASLKDSLPFVRRVFAGEKITAVCSPVPQ